MNRGDLTDEQWKRLAALDVLPPQKPHTGRTAEDHRKIINGIVWVLRTGAPWRDVPLRYGPSGTISSRFYRWRQQGIWDAILKALQTEADAQGELDWEIHQTDSTVVRSHQHAAGAKKSTEDQAFDEGLGLERRIQFKN